MHRNIGVLSIFPTTSRKRKIKRMGMDVRVSEKNDNIGIILVRNYALGM